jgi:hypothetical protein
MNFCARLRASSSLSLEFFLRMTQTVVDQKISMLHSRLDGFAAEPFFGLSQL